MPLANVRSPIAESGPFTTGPSRSQTARHQIDGDPSDDVSEAREREPPAGDRLEVYLFGLPRLRNGDRSAPFPTQKSLSMLAKLMLSAGRPLSRGALAGLYWGDSPEPKAKKSLNTELWRIRRLFKSLDLDPDAYLVSDADSVVFRADAPFWLDVKAFEDGIAAGFASAAADETSADPVERLEASVSLVVGDLLEGCDDAWVSTHRALLTDQYVLALEYLVAANRQRRAFDRAIIHARRLLDINPYSEAGHFELMLCLFLKGRRSDALRHYRTCVDVLRDDLGCEPMPATTWLVDVIRGHVGIDAFRARIAATEDLPGGAGDADTLQQALIQLRAP